MRKICLLLLISIIFAGCGESGESAASKSLIFKIQTELGYYAKVKIKSEKQEKNGKVIEYEVLNDKGVVIHKGSARMVKNGKYWDLGE